MVLLGKALARATTNPDSKSQPDNIREKLVVLSKEEHQQRLQAEQTKLNHLTQILNEEREAHARNSQKITVNWRRMLSMIKSEDFKRELEMQSFLFAREIDAKDSFVQSLDSRLEDCLEQYQCALRSHFIHLDKYSQLLNEKLANLETSFQENLQMLKEEFASEHETITHMHGSQVS